MRVKPGKDQQKPGSSRNNVKLGAETQQTGLKYRRKVDETQVRLRRAGQTIREGKTDTRGEGEGGGTGNETENLEFHQGKKNIKAETHIKNEENNKRDTLTKNVFPDGFL